MPNFAEEKQLKKRDIVRKKAELEHGRKKVRSLAERKRAKSRQMENTLSELTEERKLQKKLKTGRISKNDYDTKIGKIYKKSEYGIN